MVEYIVAALADSSERHYEERLRLQEIRDSSNPFELAEEKFRKLFRLSKSGAQHLIDSLNDPRLAEENIPKHLKVLSALEFFAQGSYQAAVGQDNFLGLSQPTVSRCLDMTVNAVISELGTRIIKFPTTMAEKQAAKSEFEHMFNMPNTLGAVDGTQIAIFKPPINHPTAPGSLFYNRKGFYSINCQIVCSASGKIIGINPNFPGSTHDAAIWGSSHIRQFLKNEFVQDNQNQWLLGDKGYPLEPWLMTPIMEPTNEAETQYNTSLARARNVVEMCNGRLKNKFRCLHRDRHLHYNPQKSAKIIITCCILYNMYSDSFYNEDDDIEEELREDRVADPAMEDEDSAFLDFLSQARTIRQNFINTHFG